MLFDWFKILKNLEEKRGKNEGEIHAILHRYSFPVSRMESEGTILECASNYMKKKTTSLYFLSCLKKFLHSLTLLEKYIFKMF